MKELILKIMRKVLPPFHPLKYWYIEKFYPKQKQGWELE